jgi:hypothetical protein
VKENLADPVFIVKSIVPVVDLLGGAGATLKF